MTVNFVKVKSGHDKNHIYVILREDERFVYLVNGTTKKIDNPKKKLKKHIQIIKNFPKHIAELFLEESKLSNENVKAALIQYETKLNKTENV